jgi:hypothetical protein
MFHAPFVAGRKGYFLEMTSTVSPLRPKLLWKAGRST